VIHDSPLTASAAEDSSPHWAVQAVDAVAIRPLAAVGSVVSTGVYIVLLPVTFPTGTAGELTYPMVFAPWRFTGTRMLGSFTEYKDGGTIYR
jgi:hypothetical protein